MEENIPSIFPQPITYATFGQRYAALALDWVIVAVPNIIITGILGWHNVFVELIAEQPITFASILSTILIIIVDTFYFAFMESRTSQATFGKIALNIYVTDMAGSRISFSKALVRNLGKYISGIIVFFGFLMMRTDARKQTLHDKIAGTLVIKKSLVAT